MTSNVYMFHFIRHGESVINTTPDIIGQDPEVPLTKKGIDQAFDLSKKINFGTVDFVYASTYKRAKDTAFRALVESPTVPITLVPELREYSAGDAIGKSRNELFTPDIVEKMDKNQMGFAFEGGETLHQVERRASKWLEDEILYNKKYKSLNKDLTFAIFSHGQTIKCLLHYIMGFDQSFTWRIKLDNTSISTVSYSEDKGWFLHGINR